MHTNSRTIFLLVEDDPKDVYLVKEVFQSAGHSHVVLLDLKMPRVNGLEFLNWLRHESPNTLHLLPVVVMSSSNDPKEVEQAYELVVNSYLLKPIQWQEFKERLNALNIFWSDHVEKPVIS